MPRTPTLRLDLPALAHNLGKVREAAPGCRVAAAVKAEGYGHGLATVARALSPDAFAVSCLDEAVTLREAGVTRPIVILQGLLAPEGLPLAARTALELVVHHLDQVLMLEHARLESPVRVWLKVDSGMHRLGIAPDDVAGAYRRLRACSAVSPAIGIMSHLARADERDADFTLQQLRTFERAADGLPGDRSLASSAGVLAWPQTHLDWVRPGVMLYGVSPFADAEGADHGLLPVMTLETRLIAIRRLRKGEAVGYGGTWVSPEDMDVGVAAIGYGDGYPRHAPNGTPVLVNGRRAPLVGRVSMDMITLDLRGHPGARPGDPVVLWGQGLPVEGIARAAGTIPYTLLCGAKARVEIGLGE